MEEGPERLPLVTAQVKACAHIHTSEREVGCAKNKQANKQTCMVACALGRAHDQNVRNSKSYLAI